MNEVIIRSIFVIISGMIFGFIIANLLYKDNKEEYYNFLKLNAIIYLGGLFIGLLIFNGEFFICNLKINMYIY